MFSVVEACLPSVVTAATQTMPIRATRRAYSTREAARSLRVFARSHAKVNS